MRILALDVGSKRIGLALSDPTKTIATPLGTMNRRGGGSDADEILRLIAKHDVGEIVIGLPVSLSGQIGPQAKSVAEFSSGLSKRISIPIIPVDERYSSVQAKRLMIEAGVKPSRNKHRVDATAAAVILQGYLDSKSPHPF